MFFDLFSPENRLAKKLIKAEQKIKKNKVPSVGGDLGVGNLYNISASVAAVLFTKLAT